MTLIMGSRRSVVACMPAPGRLSRHRGGVAQRQSKRLIIAVSRVRIPPPLRVRPRDDAAPRSQRSRGTGRSWPKATSTDDHPRVHRVQATELRDREESVERSGSDRAQEVLSLGAASYPAPRDSLGRASDDLGEVDRRDFAVTDREDEPSIFECTRSLVSTFCVCVRSVFGLIPSCVAISSGWRPAAIASRISSSRGVSRSKRPRTSPSTSRRWRSRRCARSTSPWS